MTFPFNLAKSDIEAGGIFPASALGEAEYFRLRNSHSDVGDYLPLPSGVKEWRVGRYKGVAVLLAFTDFDMYIIGKSDNGVYALYHYVTDEERADYFRLSYTLPRRILNISQRSENEMTNLEEMMSGYNAFQQNGGNMPMSEPVPGMMPQQPQQPQQNMVPNGVNMGDGISGGVNVRKLCQTAKAFGYVFGYVLMNAPQCTMSLARTNTSNGPIYNIEGKESKPSRPIAVLMTLPARCVKRGGILAAPNEIMNGMVDFNTIPNTEMVNLAFPMSAAISYITALGGRLPEYAPNVADSNKQWSAEDILSGKPEVSYVEVRSSERKSALSRGDRFRFSLKTTSARRSLYTRGNVMCLRALEHISTAVKSVRDEMVLNESAFGSWRFRHPTGSDTTVLDKAYSSCPSKIWAKDYVIDGEKVDGIGSVFFLQAGEDKNEAGEPVLPARPTYHRWYETGKNRSKTPVDMEKIVKRTREDASEKHGARSVTKPILWEQDPNNEMFGPYASFATKVTSIYVSRDKLISMSATRTKKSNNKGMSSEAMSCLKQFIQSQTTQEAIQAVQEEFTVGAILSNK